jgi:hypothetical protein
MSRHIFIGAPPVTFGILNHNQGRNYTKHEKTSSLYLHCGHFTRRADLTLIAWKNLLPQLETCSPKGATNRRSAIDCIKQSLRGRAAENCARTVAGGKEIETAYRSSLDISKPTDSRSRRVCS